MMTKKVVSLKEVLAEIDAMPPVKAEGHDFIEKNCLKTRLELLPSAQPGCEDAVPRTSVEYICKKNTVSTNPYEHKYHDKFIQFMDNPEISDFGRWQHSNGFNTALVAVKCDLDKVPSVTPKQPGWTHIEEALPETIINKHTNDYQEYNCLCDFGDYGFDVRTYKFGNGHFWNGGGIVDKYVTAWQPLPEIPDALKSKPWEGGQDGV